MYVIIELQKKKIKIDVIYIYDIHYTHANSTLFNIGKKKKKNFIKLYTFDKYHISLDSFENQ